MRYGLGGPGTIQMVLFDVDGVLTDGTLILDGQGEALKRFHVRDGLAVALLHAHGVQAGIVSGKASAPLDHRVAQLGFDVAITGRLDKVDAVNAVATERGIDLSTVAYVGDDVVDLALIGHVGRFYAPSDAHPLVLARADHVVSARGGTGVAREVAEHILTTQGLSLEQLYVPLQENWDHHNAAQ